MLRRTRSAGALLALALAHSPLGAQTPAQRCVNGVPAFPTGAHAHAVAALDSLSWNRSHAAYARVQATDGPAAGLDEIVSRARALFTVVSMPDSLASPYFLRIAVLREEVLDAENGTAVRVSLMPNFADTRPETGSEAGQVRLFQNPDAEDRRIVVSFARDSTTAVAICAASQVVHAYLGFLLADSVRAVAERYAELSRRWDRYVEQGYSMTLLERLVHSCRLGFVSRVLAPAQWSACASGRDGPLGPPAARSVILHPSFGLSPVSDSIGSFATVAVVEWYGMLFHQYRADRVHTFGASFASMFPERGASRIGVMLHTPFGRAGIFRPREEDEGWQARVAVTGDLLGWIPGNRRATRDALSGWLSGLHARELGALAERTLPHP